MLAPRDRLVLAPGVRLVAGALVDEVRAATYPLNAAAEVMLARAGEPLVESAVRIADRWGLPAEIASRDVMRCAAELNRHALANVECGAGALTRALLWVSSAVRLLPTGRLPGMIRRRRALDTRNVATALASSLRALWRRCCAVAGLASATLLLVGAPTSRDPLVSAVLLGAATGLALAVHEAAHVAALVGRRASLVLAGGRTSVLHADLPATRATVVALAGPLATAALGVGLASAGLLLGAATVALVACPFAGHALAVTLAGSDGRRACRRATGRAPVREGA